MTTQSQAQHIMDHVLGVVFKLPPNNVLQKALDYGMYILLEDFITQTDKTLDNLKYLDSTGALQTLPSGISGMLKSFKSLVAYLVLQGATIDNNFWTNITRGDYYRFRISTANNISPL